MRDLDETDLQILRLLVDDARRPYSDIAEEVGVSPPTVSDRVDRLEEVGVIERFTLDLDRSMLDEGVAVLVELTIEQAAVAGVAETLSRIERVQHVFETADGRVVFKATVEQDGVRELVAEAVDLGHLVEMDVDLLADAEWSPQVSGTGFAIDCDECGNRVTEEGTTVRLDGDLYHFCCSSCRSNFEERYEQLKTAA